MNKQGNGAIITIMAVIIGAVITVFLTQAGVFKTAEVAFLRDQYTEEICPSTLGSIFQVNIQNIGELNTPVSAAISTSHNISVLKKEDNLIVLADQSVPIKFLLNESVLNDVANQKLKNATVNLSLSYQPRVWKGTKNIPLSCQYMNEFGTLRLKKG